MHYTISFHVYRGFRAATISAVTAATKRSMQLGGTSDEEIQNKYGLWEQSSDDYILKDYQCRVYKAKES